ncbi:MAG: lysylphosphatidylglycerol synthase domain-containing protein [Gelidibacter sp.]
MLVLIKIGLVAAAYYFIYGKLFHNSALHIDEFVWNLMNFSLISTNTVFILLVLSAFNWGFEFLKWQTLVYCITKISFNEAAKQTLGALTASLFTPNRIGDYGAKAMYYQRHQRKKIVLLNLIGNTAQMIVTTIFGAIGIIYFTLSYQPDLNYNGLFIGLGVLGFTATFLIWTLKTNGFKKLKKLLYKQLDFLKHISKNSLFKILLFSLVRYLIFSFQFYYLLYLFGIEMNYFEAMAVISSMYLLSSIIPSIFIFDVIIKGGVAIYLFGLIGVPEAIILSIVTLMWILNFVLPSLIGGYHVLKFKLPKTVS